MAQINDVMHALAAFDAARQELAWAYSGDFTDVPEPMKGAVHTISEVLNEAEMRWVTSTREEPPMAAVVATGHEEKKKRVDVDTRTVGEAERKIKGWLLRLEEVACDMRAVAQKELLSDYSKIDDKLICSARWLPCLPRTRRAARIAPTIDTVALKLEELTKQYEEFGYSTGLPLASTCTEQPACSSAAGGQEERETSVTGHVLVEREDVKAVKEWIIDINHVKLLLHNYTATILPIVGPPCAGKTTLAKSVFDELNSFNRPCCKVWVDMVKGWDIKEISESIIEVLEQHKVLFPSRAPEVEREADDGIYIKQMLRRKNVELFLVLDNLQKFDCCDEERMLEELNMFLHNCLGYPVTAIVTTPSQAIAKFISAENNPYRLHPWSDEMCWEIIKRTSGLDLEATAAAGTTVAVSEMDGREIASKCSGIPLAAKALGRFLQSVDPQEWPGLIRDVWNIGGWFSRDSQQLRRLPMHSATVFTHLKRSSGVLGEAWLCLAYCAFVFPKGKGRGVATCDLLSQWCSLGITTREGGASCISELLDRSLILGEGPASYVSKAETEAPRLLRMEDLMHDFARYHLGDRLVTVDGTNGAAPPTWSSPVNNNKSSRSAYLALLSNFDSNQQLDITSILPAGILALRFEDCREMELSEVEFASANYACLRLLDLSGCSVKKLPHSIGHLKRLRYLKAPGIEDQVFPRPIIGLYELRYLILPRSCQLSDLTEAFERLSNLLHLDLSGCIGLKALPKSFGKLWRLEHLDLSACSGLDSLPNESFGWLRSLRHLDLSACSGLNSLPDDSFSWLQSLKHLDLAGCSGLKELPGSFERLAGVLRHLDLSRCSGLELLPSSLDRFSELRHLNLSELSGITQFPNSWPDKLVHLDLSGCSRITKVPNNRWPDKLVHVDLSGCSGLTGEVLGPISQLERLQYLDLSGCSRLWLSWSGELSDGIERAIRRNRGRVIWPIEALWSEAPRAPPREKRPWTRPTRVVKPNTRVTV